MRLLGSTPPQEPWLGLCLFVLGCCQKRPHLEVACALKRFKPAALPALPPSQSQDVNWPVMDLHERERRPAILAIRVKKKNPARNKSTCIGGQRVSALGP